MGEPLATISDITRSGHPLPSTDQVWHAEHLLRLGSALLRLRFPTLDARIAAGTPSASLVADVLVAMVRRAPSVAYPDRIKSESTATYSVTYDGVTGPAGEELWFTPNEIALLAVPGVARAPFGSATLLPRLA